MLKEVLTAVVFIAMTSLAASPNGLAAEQLVALKAKAKAVRRHSGGRSDAV